MFAKLFNTVATIALASVLAAGGFVGYLVGTGKLNAARVELVADVLRGKLDQLPDPNAVPASQPTTQAAREVPRAPTEDEVRELRKREHLERLAAERAVRDLEAQQRLLDQALQHVLQEQEKLALEKSEFARQREQIKVAAHDEGFQKELELVSGLAPRQAKEHVVRLWERQPADAVRLMNAMDEGRARRILEQFKTPAELSIQTDLLEQIRLQGMEGNAEQSGMTRGAAAR